MPLVAVTAGSLLVLTGLLGYALSDAANPVTSLIPLAPGVPILLCGILAHLKPGARKHAMHVAAMFGLLGALAAAGGIVMRYEKATGLGLAVMASMAVVCTVFTGLCVKNFRDVRRARREAANDIGATG